MVRGGAAIFRCQAEDSSHALEVPQWMFDAATCRQMRTASQAIVACRALYGLLELVETNERIASTPVLQAEHLLAHAKGGAHATEDSKDYERATAIVPADGAAALDGPASRDAPVHVGADRTTAAPARSHSLRVGGAR